ncbi:hypothetical protein B0H16DRAFT_1504422 [Mycena metata]|uniref:F-box domain-containing protein n=1 Tax=Mycena metata TaxID=1033252 RepID=A0AAD7K2U9_9AGAR|nr:hypothetical protein B0H16DRAFT_1504422 [Mycena metata]
MVLTRRAYKSIARWLPNEVISEIIQAAPPCDQASLCRTTKLFEGLGAPILYRVVNLKRVSIMAFCSTIASHTSKFAKLVRSFTAHADFSYFIQFQLAALWKCVKTLLNLERLRIRGYLAYAREAPEWLSLTFPRLIHCELYATSSESREQQGMLASFLLRHPALKSVHIQDFTTFESPAWSLTPARIPLHDLQRIWAPPTVFPGFVVDDLREVRLDWECDHEVMLTPAEPTFIALSAMARDGPPVCSVYCSGFEFPSIMDSASKHIPRAKVLRIMMDDLDTRDASAPDKISQVKNHLPCFTHLEFFAFESLDEVDGRLTFGETEAEDQLTVHDFGDLCPTLQACRLSENAWRRVNGAWERFSADDFLALAGITLVGLSG